MLAPESMVAGIFCGSGSGKYEYDCFGGSSRFLKGRWNAPALSM